MVMPFFIWNGVDSRDMGLIVERYPDISRAKERVESVTIPGRAGSLTLLQGEDVYDDVLYSLTAIITPEADLQAVIRWLRGAGTLILGNDAGFIRQARIINQIAFAKIINAGHREFSIPFACGPFKTRFPEDVPQVLSEPGMLYNDGDVISYPRITITGRGGITLTIDGITAAFQIPPTYDPVTHVDNSGLIIDWDTETATDLTGAENYNNYVSGDRQRIPPGQYAVTWEVAEEDSQLTYITIEERRRWL